jgi:hypothetical protein
MVAIEDDEDYEGWESDDEVLFTGLFSSDSFSSVEKMCAHHLEHFNIDIPAILSSMEEHNIMLVNFIRSVVVSGALDTAGIAILQQKIADKVHLDEKYMKPVLEDDQLLFLINDYMYSQENFTEEECDMLTEKNQLASVEQLQTEVDKYKLIVSELTKETAEEKYNDKYYFDGYSNIGIHEVMLRDAPRTLGYLQALSSSKHIKDKFVMDVGCGTGICTVVLMPNHVLTPKIKVSSLYSLQGREHVEFWRSSAEG